MKTSKTIKSLYIFLLISFIAIITSCKSQEPSKQDLEKELTSVVASWLKYFNNYDIESLMELYDDSVLFANSGLPLKKGKAELRQNFENSFKIKPTITSKVNRISVEGNIGIVLAEYEFKAIVEGKQINQKGRFLVVYKKFEDGKWRMTYDMDNVAPDVDPSLWKL